ncbi:hypothetical protein MLD38_005037 [Melastoma candidum]|uniref:Uncharacterized protein n=1 Tax=Melastoma candidum TaxID=119954 RepID=A0ACB9S958_9MYRT|nr:hypothetical protein MLD38_005037 [Melastoma candidum]
MSRRDTTDSNARSYALFSKKYKTIYQGGVTTDEVVHGPSQGQLADRGEHPKSITSKKHNILRVQSNTWDFCIGNVLNGIGCTSVLCDKARAHLNLIIAELNIIGTNPINRTSPLMFILD